MDLPLKNTRVLDIAQVLAGPYGAAMLGDLGADVIKIEPLRGDESRHLGPGKGSDSALFIGANRSKRGIALDLTSPAGLAVFHDLLKDADIVIDNLRPSAKRKLGVDYPALRAVNPQVIAINVSAFGNDGPYAGRPGIDPLAQALGGIMDVTGEPNGRPIKTGSPVVDGTTAHLVVIAALSALRLRDSTGRGQLVEVNLLEGLLNLQPSIVSQALIVDYVPPKLGCGSDLISPYGLFECADGKYLQVVGLNDKFFANICVALNCEALTTDSRFITMAGRLENNEALEAIIAQKVSEKDSDELMRRFVECDVMAAPVNSMRDSLRDPQVLHNGLVAQARHRNLGTIGTGTLPIKFAAGKHGNLPAGAAPALGEHSESVLRELGYSERAIADLIEQGVLGVAY
ncbi:MAG: CoA transferase [Halieaceae bacterium]|jgi:crotonobetainyl-CoA:carnitine CoA-transferase CaiB-like acyl-CoA transferase|nr:CoA transferase [Halieaceae bacterium]